MSLEDALKKIDPRWIGEFQKFVEKGEASDGFFEYLDSSADCQAAVDMVLERKSRGLERVADFLRSEEMQRPQDRPAMDLKAVHLARALGVASRLSATDFPER